MRQTSLVTLLVSIVLGCSNVPFNKTTYVSLGNTEPETVLENHSRGIPDKIQTLNSVVFEFGRHKMMGLGPVMVDNKNKTFVAACIDPIGYKLFEISGTDKRIEKKYVSAVLAKYVGLAKAVGADIRRIYFNLIPSADAQTNISEYEIVFKQKTGPGVTEYVFSGAGAHLTNKRYFENNICLWEVSYYEYKINNGKLYPGGIILDNLNQDYRLIVRLKEVQKDESP